MKTATINQYGSADVIEIMDAQRPKAGPGQVLIKVYASSINPFDIKLREGYMKEMIPLKFPFTLGGDVAGVITEVGEGVEGFNVGNKVYGTANALTGATGAFGEFAAAPASAIARMPSNLDFNQAAAVVLTGVSALQALLEHIKLQSGQKVLIHGGAGGIGTMAIQIAKSLKAYVVTTATGQGIEYVKRLGADHVIDYKKENFEQLISGYDAVFDTVGGEVFEKSFTALKKGGIIVSMAAKDEKKLAEQYEVIAITQGTKVNTEHLNMLTTFLESKKVKAHIDKIFSLDNIKEAFKYQEAGSVLGKVVIEIKK